MLLQKDNIYIIRVYNIYILYIKIYLDLNFEILSNKFSNIYDAWIPHWMMSR